MTPGARLAAAIEILREVAGGAAPADRIVADYFRRRRYAGSKDRAAVQARVYGVLRRLAALRWHLATAGDADARAWVIADLALVDDHGPDDVAAVFTGDGYAPPALSESERATVAALAGQPLVEPAMADAARYNYPEWLDAALRGAFGAAFVEEMTALNGEAEVDLRVNTMRATRAEASEALAADGVEHAATPLSPVGLRLAGRRPLGGLTTFRRGLVEPQDEGSQLLALIADARPGQTVIDLCAGAGGKTLALAAAMAGEGRLLACDRSATRLARLAPRLERAGIAAGEIVEVRPLRRGDPWYGAAAGSADRVLVDAPCSGTGTWRRHPYARWRLSDAVLVQYTRTQARLLTAAAALVRPGGRLIYATCSVLPQENEQQVDTFLARNSAFTRLDVADLWPAAIGGTCPLGGSVGGPDLRLTSAAHGTDGVYAAVLTRSSA